MNYLECSGRCRALTPLMLKSLVGYIHLIVYISPTTISRSASLPQVVRRAVLPSMANCISLLLDPVDTVAKSPIYIMKFHKL